MATQHLDAAMGMAVGAWIRGRRGAGPHGFRRLPEPAKSRRSCRRIAGCIVAQLAGEKRRVVDELAMGGRTKEKAAGGDLLAKPATWAPYITDHPLIQFRKRELDDCLVVEPEDRIHLGRNPVLLVGSVNAPCSHLPLSRSLDLFPRREHHCCPEIHGDHDPPAAASHGSE